MRGHRTSARKEQSGFIKMIIIIVIALIILGYLGFNIQTIINSPTVSGNLNYAWGLVVSLWNNVLVGPVTFVWQKIVVGLVWEPLQQMINKSYKIPNDFPNASNSSITPR